MAISEALVIGEDWISEHYVSTEATKQSFQARVLERRKTWEADRAAGAETVSSRFTAARSQIEKALVTLTPDGAEAAPLSAEHRLAARELADLLLSVLGFRTGEHLLRDDGPLTWVAPPGLPEHPPLVIVRARPLASLDDLVAKHAPTLLEPWEREGLDPIQSVSTALSTLLTDADGPAFALVLAGRWCLIAERERWPEGRWLAVDLQLVCERNDTRRGGEVDRALTCLDAASLAPDAAGVTWWRETLEDSVKHTVGVSKDLREGVRLSIEILANDVLRRRATAGMPPLPASAAQDLAVQCLRYLYRILFLLYAEASPELGVLPVGAQEYDAGYGLDRLRDLALTEIHGERARTGTHLHESLGRLFELVDTGHAPPGPEDLAEGLEFHGLRADLFAPRATALINETKLSNEALLAVLRMLLLSKESARAQRGFISYVDLGINQLGAVYEGLMSYTGSFATEDLFEVARGGDATKGSWVVPVGRSDHLDRADFVMVRDEETGEPRRVLHRAGTFVFRLSGRDRQRSASYYTPEVLTKFTVQQALEELLDQDGARTSAAEILGLTVCEPALGSGAFAIEAVRQLAEEYLSRREAELGARVDPTERPTELQRVKAHLALHQVYGVDLNATAVELAEVSLWLDTMVAGLAAPWFGLRLRRGNSLVGARHALYAPGDLAKGQWRTTPPRDVPLSELAAAVASGGALDLDGAIHHFLLPAQGWGAAVEVPKVVRDLVPDERLKTLKSRRTGVRRSPSKAQVKELQALAVRVETLWGIALRRLRIAEAESARDIPLWGRDEVAPGAGDAAAAPVGAGSGPAGGTVTREQIEASLADADGAYRRLRTLMDAWCALWYWPLTQFDVEPPTWEQWLGACRAILGTPDLNPRRRQAESFADVASWDELNVAEEVDRELAGALPIDRVLSEHPWLRVCERVASEQGFFHWELDFATVFARGGFDLQVGNPPWVRPNVEIEPLLAEGDPWWALALKPSETEKAAKRRETLRIGGTWRTVIDGSVESSVLGDVLGDPVMYPVLSGRPDLYRGFMAHVWRHASPSGVSGLIHMETHFTDDKAGSIRAEAYRRLRRHWQFFNEKHLFEIQNQKQFGVNIYGAARSVYFKHAASLYHPDTIIRSLAHDGSGPEPGFKEPDGQWDLRPHQGRLQHVDEAVLQAWRDVLESSAWPSAPMVYGVNSAVTRVLVSLSNTSRIKGLALAYSAGWNETTDKQSGRFVADWGAASWRDAILQGSHLFVSNPQYKSPNSTLRNHRDWTATDLEALAADALPVTAYKPAGDRLAYDASYTHWGDERTPARDRYRVAWRRQAANTGERTLIPALIPPGATHVDGIFSAAAPDARTTVVVASVLSSLLSDFSIRAAPKGDIRARAVERLAMAPLDHPLVGAIILRTLRLNCVTDAYADLWRECWDDAFLDDAPILERFDERPIGPEWTADTPLRRAVDRRNAQVEIDAIVALMLDVPVEDLCTIYRTQFAVLYGYDHREYTFDANGRLVPTPVLQEWRKQGEPTDPSAMSPQDRTAIHPGSGIAYTYDLPFPTRDRESDFRTCYAAWQSRLSVRPRPDERSPS